MTSRSFTAINLHAEIQLKSLPDKDNSQKVDINTLQIKKNGKK